MYLEHQAGRQKALQVRLDALWFYSVGCGVTGIIDSLISFLGR